MAEQGFTLIASELRRIGAAVLKSEAPTAPVAAPAPPATTAQLPAPIRAVLLEPLSGHGSALALRSRRIVAHEIQDVQVVGTPGEHGRFKLKIAWNRVDYVSEWISISDSADQVYTALQPWTFAPSGDLYVSQGAVDPETIPDQFVRPEAPLVTARWSISFIGPAFDDVLIPPVEVAASDLRGSALVITHPSSWEVTDDIVQVFEGGLMADRPVSEYHTSRSAPLPAGTAVVCVWLPDAEGYVVIAAEPRKYSILGAVL